MATYGDKTEPGIITQLDSALSVSTAGVSPSDVGIVGQADLTNGTADPNTAYEVTRATEARTLFGDEDESLLTNAIIDALVEGALPIYAVATSGSPATDDLSGLASTSGTLVNAPVSEDAADTSFVIDGVSKSTVVVYDDPSTYAPGADEVYLNPVTGEFELDGAPGDTDDTNDTVEYTYFEYDAALDALANQEGDEVDFVVPLSENQDVVGYAQTVVNNLANDYEFAILLAAPAMYLDPQAYVQEYNDSRLQVIYPTRFEDNRSALGAYAGKRAALGLNRTPINTRLTTSDRLAVTLSRDDRGALLEELVVPLADEAPSTRIVDDLTTISPDDPDESNIDYGFKRLVVDYIVTVTRLNEEPFIGRLNTPTTRNSFADLVAGELDELQASNAVVDYTINVEKVSADTASLEVFVDVPAPVRFIENDFLIGSGA